MKLLKIIFAIIGIWLIPFVHGSPIHFGGHARSADLPAKAPEPTPGHHRTFDNTASTADHTEAQDPRSHKAYPRAEPSNPEPWVNWILPAIDPVSAVDAAADAYVKSNGGDENKKHNLAEGAEHFWHSHIGSGSDSDMDAEYKLEKRLADRHQRVDLGTVMRHVRRQYPPGWKTQPNVPVHPPQAANQPSPNPSTGSSPASPSNEDPAVDQPGHSAVTLKHRRRQISTADSLSNIDGRDQTHNKRKEMADGSAEYGSESDLGPYFSSNEQDSGPDFIEEPSNKTWALKPSRHHPYWVEKWPTGHPRYTVTAQMWGPEPTGSADGSDEGTYAGKRMVGQPQNDSSVAISYQSDRKRSSFGDVSDPVNDAPRRPSAELLEEDSSTDWETDYDTESDLGEPTAGVEVDKRMIGRPQNDSLAISSQGDRKRSMADDAPRTLSAMFLEEDSSLDGKTDYDTDIDLGEPTAGVEVNKRSTADNDDDSSSDGEADYDTEIDLGEPTAEVEKRAVGDNGVDTNPKKPKPPRLFGSFVQVPRRFRKGQSIKSKRMTNRPRGVNDAVSVSPRDRNNGYPSGYWPESHIIDHQEAVLEDIIIQFAQRLQKIIRRNDPKSDFKVVPWDYLIDLRQSVLERAQDVPERKAALPKPGSSRSSRLRVRFRHNSVASRSHLPGHPAGGKPYTCRDDECRGKVMVNTVIWIVDELDIILAQTSDYRKGFPFWKDLETLRDGLLPKVREVPDFSEHLKDKLAANYHLTNSPPKHRQRKMLTSHNLPSDQGHDNQAPADAVKATDSLWTRISNWWKRDVAASTSKADKGPASLNDYLSIQLSDILPPKPTQDNESQAIFGRNQIAVAKLHARDFPSDLFPHEMNAISLPTEVTGPKLHAKDRVSVLLLHGPAPDNDMEAISFPTEMPSAESAKLRARKKRQEPIELFDALEEPITPPEEPIKPEDIPGKTQAEKEHYLKDINRLDFGIHASIHHAHDEENAAAERKEEQEEMKKLMNQPPVPPLPSGDSVPSEWDYYYDHRERYEVPASPRPLKIGEHGFVGKNPEIGDFDQPAQADSKSTHKRDINAAADTGSSGLMKHLERSRVFVGEAAKELEIASDHYRLMPKVPEDCPQSKKASHDYKTLTKRNEVLPVMIATPTVTATRTTSSTLKTSTRLRSSSSQVSAPTWFAQSSSEKGPGPYIPDWEDVRSNMDRWKPVTHQKLKVSVSSNPSTTMKTLTMPKSSSSVVPGPTWLPQLPYRKDALSNMDYQKPKEERSVESDVEDVQGAWSKFVNEWEYHKLNTPANDQEIQQMNEHVERLKAAIDPSSTPAASQTYSRVTVLIPFPNNSSTTMPSITATPSSSTTPAPEMIPITITTMVPVSGDYAIDVVMTSRDPYTPRSSSPSPTATSSAVETDWMA